MRFRLQGKNRSSAAPTHAYAWGVERKRVLLDREAR
jgi:hypothetical protein